MNYQPSAMSHIVCIGAMLVDELYYCNEPAIAGTSNPAMLKKTAGGVMRNIAHHLVLLQIPATFITVSGNDADGQWLTKNCVLAGIDMSAAIVADCATGKYTAILNPDGSLYAAAVVNPAADFITIKLLQQRAKVLMQASMIVADTNLSVDVLSWLIAFCHQQKILLCIEPVSVGKAKKLEGINLQGVYLITPNEDELASLTNASDEAAAIDTLLASGAKNIWLTRGIMGSTLFTSGTRINLPAITVPVKDVTGAGDALLAAWVAAFYHGKDVLRCMQAGHVLATAVVQEDGAIATGITPRKLLSDIQKYYPDEA